MRDDHRPLAVQAIRSILVLAAALALALLAAGRGSVITGLLAGVSVGVVDVLLLSRSLDRFGRNPDTSAKTLGTAMFSRFLSVGVLLGLVLCLRTVNPVAAVAGFLLMPLAVGATGARDARRRRIAAEAVA